MVLIFLSANFLNHFLLILSLFDIVFQLFYLLGFSGKLTISHVNNHIFISSFKFVDLNFIVMSNCLFNIPIVIFDNREMMRMILLVF